MCTCVFASGYPIDSIGPRSANSSTTGRMLDQIVVSVGPYMFHNPPTRLRSQPANSPGNASPPHNAFRLERPSQCAARNNRHVAGVACIIVMPKSSNARISCVPSLATSRLANTQHDPLINGR